MAGEDRAGVLRIVTDHREGASGVVEALRRFDDLVVEMAQLFVGDYVLGPDVVVERKTISDLVASIIDRRLFDQLGRLQAACEHPLFVLEGPDPEEGLAIHRNAWLGALSYIQVLQHIPVLRTRDAEETALLLHIAARHVQKGLDYRISLHHKPKASDPAAQQRYVLGAFPGIGPALAKALLEHFGSLEAVLHADEGMLCQVAGVGPVTAAKIRALLAYDYAGRSAA